MITIDFQEQYNLALTMDCGQIFRFHSMDYGKTYYGPVKDRILKISQKNPNTLEIHSNNEIDLMPFLTHFFRLKDDYLEMINAIKIDPLMGKITSEANGLHLLQQDPFECTIAYLLSQCSNIPRIKSNLESIAMKWGKPIKYDDKDFFLFPKIDDLKVATEEDFRNLKFGYRSKYISHFIHNYPNFLSESIENSSLFNLNLKSLPGIGQKVADCIQLFAYGDLSWFPVDTWIRKFMQKYYSSGELAFTSEKYAEMGRKMFGRWAGYAQEFIYYYSRCLDPSI